LPLLLTSSMWERKPPEGKKKAGHPSQWEPFFYLCIVPRPNRWFKPFVSAPADHSFPFRKAGHPPHGQPWAIYRLSWSPKWYACPFSFAPPPGGRVGLLLRVLEWFTLSFFIFPVLEGSGKISENHRLDLFSFSIMPAFFSSLSWKSLMGLFIRNTWWRDRPYLYIFFPLSPIFPAGEEHDFPGLPLYSILDFGLLPFSPLFLPLSRRRGDRLATSGKGQPALVPSIALPGWDSRNRGKKKKLLPVLLAPSSFFLAE